MDAATKLTIDRGRKNQEILKQPQFAPVPVEEQVAIILASTRGFLDKVPVEKVKEFEKDFLLILKAQHRKVLDNLRAGKLEEQDIDLIKKIAQEVAGNLA